MPVGAEMDVAAVGKHFRQKVMLALSLCSALPLLILVYVVHQYVLLEVVWLEPRDRSSSRRSVPAVLLPRPLATGFETLISAVRG